MRERIRQRALELGFDDCRFTGADAPASIARYRRWLETGAQGEMGYLERHLERKEDPSRVLPDVRSVVMLAVSYSPSAEHAGVGSPRSEHGSSEPNAERNPLRGRVARYAQYADYHEVLATPLRELAGYIERLAGEGARSVCYVDSGPVLERDLAQRAGLGFAGKHTNLIHHGLGNWFFIAEILTTAALEPDPPAVNRCGKCSRCLSACPTRAIVAPFELDARRCISYLTIELKGSIPPEFRRAIGTRIFGCDDCLEVCPWNRFAKAGRLMRGKERADLDAPALLELLAIDDDGFRRRFRETPLWRGKRCRLLRNVCVALGNVGDERALPALEKLCHDREALIAEHARWAVDEIRSARRSSIAAD